MKKLFVLAIGAAMLVGGCVAQQSRGARPSVPRSWSPTARCSASTPSRWNSRRARVRWSSTGRPRRATCSPAAASVIEGEVDRVGGPIIDKSPTEVGRCVVTGNRQQVQCTNAAQPQGHLQVHRAAGASDGKALPAFDPYIVNKE
jgi:hypothetical protein